MDFSFLVQQNEWIRTIVGDMPKSFFPHLEVFRYPAGKIIIQKGKPNPYIFFLVEGHMSVQNEYENGKVFTYAIKNAPGFMGLLEYFADKVISTSTVKTAEECLFVRMSKQLFASWVEKDFAAYRRMTKYFAQQMYPSMSNNGNMSAYTKERTFVNYLVSHYEDEIAIHNYYRIPSTREEYANALGFSLRTVYRLIDRMEEQKLIRLSRGKLMLGKVELANLKHYQQTDME